MCKDVLAVNTLGSLGMRRQEMLNGRLPSWTSCLVSRSRPRSARKALSRVVTRTYPFGDGLLVAEFVEDVLFRYSMTSE